MQRAAPTNQWYSSLIFNATPEVIYVQPLAIKATREGFEFSLPKKQVKPSVRQDVEIHYPHQAHVTIAPTGFCEGSQTQPQRHRDTEKMRREDLSVAPLRAISISAYPGT